MAMVRLAVRDLMGSVRAEVTAEKQAVLVFNEEYNRGDTINIRVGEAGRFYVIRVDDCLDEALVYLTSTFLLYTIPFGELRYAYNPKAFTGSCHYLTIREATDSEIHSYRNLAKNVMDQRGDSNCFPHVFANVETGGEAAFAVRNVIDGVVANTSHGKWPYESWGINRQDNAEMTLAFGRPVDIDRIVLVTRADFPHDNWWKQADITFSDGTKEVVHMEKSTAPHEFQIVKKGITWMKLSRLIKSDEPSMLPSLTQLEVYGTESES